MVTLGKKKSRRKTTKVTTNKKNKQKSKNGFQLKRIWKKKHIFRSNRVVPGKRPTSQTKKKASLPKSEKRKRAEFYTVKKNQKAQKNHKTPRGNNTGDRKTLQSGSVSPNQPLTTCPQFTLKNHRELISKPKERKRTFKWVDFIPKKSRLFTENSKGSRQNPFLIFHSSVSNGHFFENHEKSDSQRTAAHKRRRTLWDGDRYKGKTETGERGGSARKKKKKKRKKINPLNGDGIQCEFLSQPPLALSFE